MRWEKKARIGIAVAGIAVAGGLFLAIGTREQHVTPAAPVRTDPKAIIESSGATVQQIRGVKEDYAIKAERQLTYESGLSKSLKVEINVKGRGGRDFVVTGNEAQGAQKDSYVDVTGEVRLRTNDGFEIATDKASFGDAEGIVRAPGPLTFHRGGMSGSGVGMTYDKNSDSLTIIDQARVVFADAEGNTTMEFTGAGATFQRREHLLAIDRGAHAVRGEQLLESDRAKAHLTDDDEQITAVELRGHSRVVGGSGAVDSMTATDIDLNYAEAGAVLQRVRLNGKAAVALAAEPGKPGRQVFGNTLSVGLAPDNSVTSVTGQGNARLDLPATATSVRRTIKARSMLATGAPGKGLTAARFTENVEYQEDAPKPGTAPRVVRSKSLQLSLTGDAVSSAAFTGGVTFDEQGLKAGAAEAAYDPSAGTLRLTGVGPAGGPRVVDQQVTVTADAIDVTLEEGHRMTATGNVKTILQSPKGQARAKMPSLLEEGQAVNVNAGALQYDGAAGRAVYTGAVQLYQADTTIRAERVAIDRGTGDFVATGGARSTLTLDTGASIGRGEEIRYTEATRQIEYLGAGATVTPAVRAAAAPGLKGPAPAPSAQPAQLSSPQGDLRGDRIAVALRTEGNDVDRLEGYGNTLLKLDARTATGNRLTYFAADGRYVMSGAAGEAVKVVDRCNETTGKTLTFFKSTDRIIIDGNEEIRTQTKNGGGPCPPSPSRPR